MARRARLANRSFLFGSGIMMFLLFAVVFLFLYWSFKPHSQAPQEYAGQYEVTLDSTLLHRPVTLFINDSVIYEGTPAEVMTLRVTRFAEHSSLLAVDGESDGLFIKILPEEDAEVTVRYEDGEIAF